MKRSRRWGLPAAAAAALLTSVAAAQVAAYDGTYVGVTAAFSGAMRAGPNTCPNFAAPALLTIAGGRAQAKWGDTVLQGEVGQNGVVVMRNAMTGKLEGQIDAHGNLNAIYSGFCNYRVSWKRQ